MNDKEKSTKIISVFEFGKAVRHETVSRTEVKKEIENKNKNVVGFSIANKEYGLFQKEKKDVYCVIITIDNQEIDRFRISERTLDLYLCL